MPPLQALRGRLSHGLWRVHSLCSHARIPTTTSPSLTSLHSECQPYSRPARRTRQKTAKHAAPVPSKVSCALDSIMKTSHTPTLPATVADYRALLLDLLLYRQETLRPVLDALQRERALLEARLREFDAHVAALVEVRETLRTMIAQQNNSTVQTQGNARRHRPHTAGRLWRYARHRLRR